MNALRVASSILLWAFVLHAEDFSLDYNGSRPITLHTTLTYEGNAILESIDNTDIDAPGITTMTDANADLLFTARLTFTVIVTKLDAALAALVVPESATIQIGRLNNGETITFRS